MTAAELLVLVRVTESRARNLERAAIFAELRAHANACRGRLHDQHRRGAINSAADRVRDRRGPGRPEDLVAAS